MKLFIVYRLDRRDGKAAEIRATTRPLHREYMNQFGHQVRMGGPVLDGEGNGCGGMMVIEAANVQEVEAIVGNDPFEQAGLSEMIQIREFRWQTNRPADLPPL